MAFGALSSLPPETIVAQEKRTRGVALRKSTDFFPGKRLQSSGKKLGRDMGGGGGQNVRGEENVPENALSRKFLDPSKRASVLHCRGFLYRKTRALTPEGVENVPYKGGFQSPFLGGVSFVRFSSPLFFSTPPLFLPPPHRILRKERNMLKKARHSWQKKK